jgi:hypothetical protein
MLHWLVGRNFLLRDFGSYGTILMKVCVVVTAVMVILLRDYLRCKIIFMTCLITLQFSPNA